MAATPQVEKARGSRLVLLIALVALSVTAAAAFARVFQGRHTTWELMAAAAISALLAAATGRRHILLAALVSAVGLALAITYLVFPETTKYGLPTPTTWRAVLAALRAVGHAAEVQVAPALPLPPLELAGLTAVWTAAFAAHSLAVRARSPFLALLPLAALLAFAGVLLEDGARPSYTMAFLAGSIALLFADGFRRVGHWGPVSVWHGRSRLGVGSRTTTRSARWLGAGCLAFAAIFPWVLPGFHAPAVVALHGNQNAKFVSIDPIVDIRPALISNHPVNLFTVQSPRAAYWRFLSLDQFDGRLWRSSNLQASGGQLVTSGSLRPGAPQPSSLPAGVATVLPQRYQFQGLTQPWLPAAFDPVAVGIVGSVARYDPVGQTLVAPNGTYQGFVYDVDSELVIPTAEQLDNEPTVSGSSLVRYTQLPTDTPPQIAAIAHRLADTKPNVYRKVLAIQDYLKGFSYDLRVRPGHDVNDILQFLTKTKAGYCEQFAGSMAVLLRSIGIPARVAVGFTPGIYDSSNNRYEVTSQNAHAWVEVLFPDYGWLAFEPTPTRSNPISAPYVTPPGETPQTGGLAGCALKNPKFCGREGLGAGNQDVGNTRRVGVDEGIPASGVDVGPAFDLPSAASPAKRLRDRALLAVIFLAVLGLLLIPVAKWARRRATLARARDPRSKVLAAYGVLTQRAADLGLGRRLEETPLEYRARLRRRVPSLDGSFDQLTQLTARAAYSESAVEREQAHRALDFARGAIRQIRKGVGWPVRLAGLFRLERFSLPKVGPG